MRTTFRATRGTSSSNKISEFSIQKFGLFWKNKPQNHAKDAIKDRFTK